METELRDTAAGSYRSRRLDSIAAGSCRRGMKKAVLEKKLRDIAAGSYRSIWRERAVLGREL